MSGSVKLSIKQVKSQSYLSGIDAHERERVASKTLDPGVAALSKLREATKVEKPSDGESRSEVSLKNWQERLKAPKRIGVIFQLERDSGEEDASVNLIGCFSPG